jgi:hypothetical protein
MQLPSIQAETPVVTPPRWAVLERELIAAMNGAAEPLLRRYVRPDGSLLWPPNEESFQSIDALDDAYESFHNWPLFYLLGGDAAFLAHSHRQFDAITAQFARYPTGQGYPMVVKEYQPAYDWFHQSEGNYLFYMLAMADPGNPRTVERARRFAGFYMNEDAEAPNYDADLRLIRCSHNGSVGPAFWNFESDSVWTQEGYGLPFYDVPGCECVDDLRDPTCMRRIARASRERRGRGDSAVNLAATSLVMTAYLLTGEGAYGDWILDYVDAWIARAGEGPGGIIPDNVGLSGRVGEYMDGKWYGGNYGWTWPHGWYSIGQAVVAAAENAYLLARETRFLDFTAGQLDALADLGIERDGTLYIPYKMGDPGRVRYTPWARLSPLETEAGLVLEVGGWHEFLPVDTFFLSHTWALGMAPEDLARAQRLRAGGDRDWLRLSTSYAKDQGGNDGPWLAYLQGQWPDYPEAILTHNLRQVAERMAFMETDDEDPATYGDAYLQFRNPITCEGLVQLTLGGPLPIYNGGLLLTRVLYLDKEAGRPGLPADVAALVSELTADRTRVTLVNLSETETRTLVVQAGSMGQHRFGAASVVRAGGMPVRVAIEGPRLEVVLPPRRQIELDLDTQCFLNDPSYIR